MSQYDYDLYVIGAGSGGVRAARIAGKLGARVAVCEERYLGGTCVNVGCVPKKLLVYGASMSETFEDAAGYGWTCHGEPTFDWGTLIARKDREIARLNGIYGGLLEGAEVDLHWGRGRLLDPHTVEVDGRQHTAKHILIATGAWPWVPDIPGREHAVTSNEAFYLETLPRRVIVVGGGYIALEFAGIFAGFGSSTRLVHRGELLLRGFDEEVRQFIGPEIHKKGVELELGRSVTRIDKRPDGLHATLDDGRVLEADLVMYATGRRPLTKDLGLEAAGVAQGKRGEIVVDELCTTNVPHIFAVGDVTDRMTLTPVALEEGMAVAQRLFGGREGGVDYHCVPTAVFSRPAVATVGMNEEEARAAGHQVVIFRSEFTPMKHTLTGRPERMLMKLIVDGESDRVLGCHVVGADAAEIVQGFAVALTCEATKAQLDRTVGIHPTAAEELVTMRTPVPAG